MAKFASAAPLERVVGALEQLGSHRMRTGNHIALVRDNPDGTRTSLTPFLRAYRRD